MFSLSRWEPDLYSGERAMKIYVLCSYVLIIHACFKCLKVVGKDRHGNPRQGTRMFKDLGNGNILYWRRVLHSIWVIPLLFRFDFHVNLVDWLSSLIGRGTKFQQSWVSSVWSQRWRMDTYLAFLSPSENFLHVMWCKCSNILAEV